MIAVTQFTLQKIFADRGRPAAGDPSESSVFSSSLTYVVGSVATRVGVRPTSAPNEGGRIDESPGSVDAHAAFRATEGSRLRPGMQLGPFRLLKLLGQGAQGDVWKAKRAGLRVGFVAVKVLSPALAALPWRLAQFRREAERGARMAGPSLLPVFEFGEEGGFVYMAMPFIEGTTLKEVIRQRRARLRGEDFVPVHRLIRLDGGDYLRSAARIMARAARALGNVHANRVVHRDIKPANILLDAHRAHGVFLCDLGLARDLDVATAEQMRDGAGTPMYMAPERLLRGLADEVLCDIYSLGVTLFETFTLSRPFRPPDDLPLACLSAYLAGAEPVKPGEVRPDLPADLAMLVRKAMARDPAERHPSAQDLAADLDRFLDRMALPANRSGSQPAPSSGAGPHIPIRLKAHSRRTP
jgi:serine/threonine protein kinase